MSEEGADRRSASRMGVQLPMRVQGRDVDGTRWEEMTTGEDISSGGAAFVLRRPVARGQALLLSMPLPKRFRAYDVMSPSYRIYALVRKVAPADAACRIGVMFLGKQAPKGFEETPAVRYRMPGDEEDATNRERRLQPRVQLFLNLRLHRHAAADGPLEEQTVALNLSRSGAQVPTTLPVVKGEILSIEEMGGTFRSRAEVKNVFLGSDRIQRLNLQFLDDGIPERLLT
jgi:hypothetical protein